LTICAKARANVARLDAVVSGVMPTGRSPATVTIDATMPGNPVSVRVTALPAARATPAALARIPLSAPRNTLGFVNASPAM
jgi:hypothetical protein